MMILQWSLDVDVGSSVIAKKVANRVGNTPEELPEHLLGTCRMSHIDTSKVACT
ncbi:hypothetical protein HanOQP8_Chr02g0081711 [Helianthus annuus]|nr:hypothetical protein HanOQP8_Chr02g0081711 [Helianthus annuus]